MKKITVKRENGKLVCDPTHTPISIEEKKRGEVIRWARGQGVGNDVVIRFEGKSPFGDGGRGPFSLDEDHAINPTVAKGVYKFEKIEGDIIID